jgi:RNA polymerase sporulation-specific sigma factor
LRARGIETPAKGKDTIDVISSEGIMAITKVEICGVQTSQLEVLDDQTMQALLKRIVAGDEVARERFVKANLRLVLSVIGRFNNRGEPVDDLFQIGCIGLIKAIDNFDLSHGVKFSTYAVPMIAGEIRRYLRDNNAVRVSRSLRDTAYKVLQTRNQLASENGKEPTIDEIARVMERPVEELVFALEAIQDPVSLFEPVYNDGGDALYIVDQVKDHRVDQNGWLQNLALEQALTHLNEREQNILYKRFFLGRTQMEIAQEIGISQAQVSRLEKAALLHMRKHF